MVCGPCSSKRFLLPNQSSKPLRVCVSCFNSLTAKIQDGTDTSRDRGNAESSGEDDSDDDEDNAKGQPESHDTVSWEFNKIFTKKKKESLFIIVSEPLFCVKFL